MPDRPGKDYIALYGSLMRNLGSMEEIGVDDRLRFVGPCRIEGQLFDLGSYPGLRRGIGIVVGEIHALLEPEALRFLDEFEGFDPTRPQESLYLRERIVLIEPSTVEAWVYFYNQAPDPGQRIESGDWRTHLTTGPGG